MSRKVFMLMIGGSISLYSVSLVAQWQDIVTLGNAPINMSVENPTAAALCTECRLQKQGDFFTYLYPRTPSAEELKRLPDPNFPNHRSFHEELRNPKEYSHIMYNVITQSDTLYKERIAFERKYFFQQFLAPGISLDENANLDANDLYALRTLALFLSGREEEWNSAFYRSLDSVQERTLAFRKAIEANLGQNANSIKIITVAQAAITGNGQFTESDNFKVSKIDFSNAKERLDSVFAQIGADSTDPFRLSRNCYGGIPIVQSSQCDLVGIANKEYRIVVNGHEVGDIPVTCYRYHTYFSGMLITNTSNVVVCRFEDRKF